MECIYPMRADLGAAVVRAANGGLKDDRPGLGGWPDYMTDHFKHNDPVITKLTPAPSAPTILNLWSLRGAKRRGNLAPLLSETPRLLP